MIATSNMLLPSQAYATYKDVSTKYPAFQELIPAGDVLHGSDIPTGTYLVPAKTSASMCVMYDPSEKPNDDDSDQKGRLAHKCLLTVDGDDMYATFYMSKAYTALYFGDADAAAAQTNEDGTDGSAYLFGDPIDGYVYRLFTIPLESLNEQFTMATYTGASEGREMWYTREVLVSSSDEVMEAISAAASANEEPSSGDEPEQPSASSEPSETGSGDTEPTEPATPPADAPDDGGNDEDPEDPGDEDPDDEKDPGGEDPGGEDPGGEDPGEKDLNGEDPDENGEEKDPSKGSNDVGSEKDDDEDDEDAGGEDDGEGDGAAAAAGSSGGGSSEGSGDDSGSESESESGEEEGSSSGGAQAGSSSSAMHGVLMSIVAPPEAEEVKVDVKSVDQIERDEKFRITFPMIIAAALSLLAVGGVAFRAIKFKREFAFTDNETAGIGNIAGKGPAAV